MNHPIRILYVDDYPLDRALVRDALEQEPGGFELVEAGSRADFEAALAQGGFDLILSDFNILGFKGLQVLEAVRASGSNLPVIIVTGTGSEEVAAEAIKRGAGDYIVKTPKHIQRLPHAIHAVLEKKRMEDECQQKEAALRESNELLSLFLKNSPIYAFIKQVTATESRILKASENYQDMTGIPGSKMVGITMEELFPADFAAKMVADDWAVVTAGKVLTINEDLNGRSYTTIKFPISMDDKNLLAGYTIDITERVHVEKLQDVIYRIAHAADQAKSLDILYQSIHAIIQEVMAADNFYIAIYDEKKDLLSFPYFVDEEEVLAPPQKLGKGLTEYVIRNAKSFLCNAAQLNELIQHGVVELIGAPMSIWLGVPLIIDGKAIGVMVVQDYKNALAYGEREQRILEFVSSQAAMAIFRKRSEENLRESRHMLRLVLDSIPVRVFWKDRDSNYLGCNRSFALDSGLHSPAELIGKNDYDMGWKEQADLYRADDRLVIESGQPRLNYEEPQTTPDGGRIWLRTSKIPLQNAAGEITGVLGTYENITARKQAEVALTASEAELRALFASMDDVVLVIDRNGIYRKVAQTNPDLLVRPPDELLGKALTDFFPPEQARFFLDSVSKVLETGQTAEFEYQLTINDRTLWFLAMVTPMTKDETVWVARDITERKQSEEFLARQAEELHRRNDELARLYRASGLLISGAALNLQDLAQKIVEVVQQDFGQGNCSLFIVKKDSNELVRLAVAGPYRGQVRSRNLDLAGPGLVTRAIRMNQVVNVRDVQSDPDYIQGWGAAQSELVVPLKIGSEVIGVIDVQSSQPGAFSSDDERLISIFAERAALALEHSRLNAQTDSRMQQLLALRTIDMAICNSFDTNLTLAILLEQVTKQLGVDAADILAFNVNTQTFKFSSECGFRTPMLQHIQIKYGAGFAWRVVRERQKVVVPDIRAEADGLQRTPDLSSEQFITYVGIPLLAKGQVKGVLEVFQREPLALDAEKYAFLEMLAGQAAIAIDNSELFEHLQSSNAELGMAYDSTLAGWANALELRDKETEGHTRRVTDLTIRLAEKLGVNQNDIVHIYRGALLHDIGKIGVPDSIVLKPGPLTIDEFATMCKHPQYAYDMLSQIAYLRQALDIPYCHHEKWDGTGYPRGLKGEQIPLGARIFSVVDVWDALTSDRPYRKAWQAEKARQYIQEQAGLQFDRSVVAAFLDPSFKRD